MISGDDIIAVGNRLFHTAQAVYTVANLNPVIVYQGIFALPVVC